MKKGPAEKERKNEPDLGFDGQIVVIVDRDISLVAEPDTIVFGEGSELEDFEFIRLLSRRFFIDNFVLKHPDAPRVYLDCIEKEFKSLFRRLCRRHGTKIARTIMEGRIKMSVLLDTAGGNTGLARIISESLKQITARGGRTDAYVPRRASSAGADIFANAQNRYVLTESRLMWHLSNITSGAISTDWKTKEELERKKEEEMAELRTMLGGIASADKRPEMLARIHEAEADENNPDNSICFTGREFYEYGAVTRMFENVLAMRKHFNRSTGICDNSRIDTFFLKSGIAVDVLGPGVLKKAGVNGRALVQAIAQFLQERKKI